MTNLAEIKKRKLKPKQLPVPENEQVQTFGLFDYQREDSQKTVATLEARGRDFLAMATGLGKTRTSIEVIIKVSRKPKKILVLADQTQLLEDHKKVFNAYIGREYAMTDFTGKSFIQRKNPPEFEVVFATRQSMRNYIDVENGNGDYLPPGFFDFILDDESHHAKAKTYEPTLHYFQPQYLLGMTGTPDRSDWRDIREIFGEPTVTRTLEEGMANGWLTSVDYDLVTMDVDEVELEKLIADKSKTLTKEELEKLIFKEKSLEEVLQHMVQAVGDKQTGIMCDSIEQAEKVSFILREWGYIAEAFHSQSGDDEEQLIRFRKKTSGFLSAVNKMNEGIDVPEMEAVVFLRSTNSKTIFLQQLGRVLRKYPGKEKALVLDYVGTIERLDLINQLILDSESESVDSDKKAVLNKTIHGGRNVFRFNRGIVSKIGEILKRNERRNGNKEGESVKREELSEMSLEDTKKICEKLHIKTRTVYNLWSSVFFPIPGSPELPGFGYIPEITPEIEEELGFNQVEMIYQILPECVSSVEDFYYHNRLDQAKFPPPWSLDGVKSLKGGCSTYKADASTYNYVKIRIAKIEKDLTSSIYYDDYAANSGSTIKEIEDKKTEWVNRYGLHFPEAIADAQKIISEIIKTLGAKGLLHPDFFANEVLDVVIEDVLWQVHNEYFGEEDATTKIGRRKKRMATKGPYKGCSPVELSKVLKGQPIVMPPKTLASKIKDLKIKTHFGYKLWVQRVFEHNLVFPGRRKDIWDGKNSVTSYSISNLNLMEFSKIDSIKDEEQKDLDNFLDAHITVMNGRFMFYTETTVTPAPDSIEGARTGDVKKGLSTEILGSENPNHKERLMNNITSLFDERFGKKFLDGADEPIPSSIRQLESGIFLIYELLSNNDLFFEELTERNYVEAIMNYVIRKLEIKTSEKNRKTLDIGWQQNLVGRFVCYDKKIYDLFAQVEHERMGEDMLFRPFSNTEMDAIIKANLADGFFENEQRRKDFFKEGLENYMYFIFGPKWHTEMEKEDRMNGKVGISNYKLEPEQKTNFGIKVMDLAYKMTAHLVGGITTPFTSEDSDRRNVIAKTLKICVSILDAIEKRKLLAESFFDEEVVETLVRLVLSKERKS